MISQLPNAENCVGYEGPFQSMEKVNALADWRSVLQSQWHPACWGYAMTEQSSTSFQDPTLYSPIFTGYSELQTPSCAVCHVPGCHAHPLYQYSLCDVDAEVDRLVCGEKKMESVKMKTIWAHTVCGNAVLSRINQLIGHLQSQFVEYVLYIFYYIF